ncbi:MAG: hypothetical protein R3F29_01305 [Planctomycetota bacterium]
MDSSPMPEAPAARVASLPDAPAPWPFWQRITFRFLLVYYLLYAFPRPLSSLLGTTAGVIAEVAKSTNGGEPAAWAMERPWRWPQKWTMELYDVEGWRKVLTSTLDEYGMVPYEVIHQPTGSGDTAHDVALLLFNLFAAVVLTGIWSALRRRPCGYPRIGRWLHLVVRFDLAFWLLGYGFAKLYGSQFGELSLTRLTQEIGDTWPMSMVGTFMQASPPYEVFGGLGEVLAGLLLFHRRTALLGALMSLAVMGNVCALNWLCGVPVKLFSTHLWLYGLFLLAPWRHALLAVLVKNRASQPVDMRLPLPRGFGWLRWPLVTLGWAWVLATLMMVHLNGIAPKPWMKGREKSELYGVWMVERMLLDGVEVPVSDATRWSFLAIDRGKLAWSRDATGAKRYFDFVWDPSTSSAEVAPRGGSSASAPWTIVQGEKVTDVDPPLVLRNEERGKKVDGTRRTLVLNGTWQGKQLELRTVEKVFRLQTGFRLRQELPDFW